MCVCVSVCVSVCVCECVCVSVCVWVGVGVCVWVGMWEGAQGWVDVCWTRGGEGQTNILLTLCGSSLHAAGTWMMSSLWR